jgi:hypothetical protein
MFYIGSLSNLLVFVHRILLSSILLTTSLDKYERMGIDVYWVVLSELFPSQCSEGLTIHHVPFPSASEIVLLATDPDIVFPSVYEFVVYWVVIMIPILVVFL